MGILVALCTLTITVVIHLIQFTALITSLQSSLASLELAVADFKSSHKDDIGEIKQWQGRVEKIVLKPSWKTSIPPLNED
jgi:hypothetical protein